MTYDVEVNGRTRHVNIERDGDAFVVTLDDRPVRVHAARVDAHIWSLVLDGRSHELVVWTDTAKSQLGVQIGPARLLVGVNGRRRWGRKEDRGHAAAGPQRIAAPMPGKVVRVLVQSGEAVHARQPLLVVEAMKMENELRASREGTVAEIHAQEGQSVDAGALLVVIQ